MIISQVGPTYGKYMMVENTFLVGLGKLFHAYLRLDENETDFIWGYKAYRKIIVCRGGV